MKKPIIHKFSAGTIEVLHSDVLHVKYTSNRKLTVEDITDVRDMRIGLIGKIPYYPIIDMTSGIVKFNDEAKAWVAVNNESISSRIIDIFLVDSIVMKFKVKIYLAIFKPINETKVVSSLEGALDAISEHRKKINSKASA